MGVVMWIVGLVLAIGGALAVALVVAEAKGWIPVVSRSVVRRAGERLPLTHRDRIEEWEADLLAYEDRPITMLVTALRIRMDARVIVREALAAVPEAAAEADASPQRPKRRSLTIVSSSLASAGELARLVQRSLDRSNMIRSLLGTAVSLTMIWALGTVILQVVPSSVLMALGGVAIGAGAAAAFRSLRRR
jgi:hypothetical protein